MESTVRKRPTLRQRWQSLDSKKLAMYSRCEQYAKWTIPHVFPELGTSNADELRLSADSLGAQAVNNLANKLVMTLFQPYTPFFRLNVSHDAVKEIADKAKQGDAKAQEAINAIDAELAQAERSAMRELNYNRFRTEATSATKSLIVTGNSLMFLPETDNGKVQVYNLRDYAVVRDLSGNVVEIMTRDMKAFCTFSTEMQNEIKRLNPNKKYSDTTSVQLFTAIALGADKKFHMLQAADDTELSSKATWTPDELPYIVLTWNLVRGEDYGRGLVEDYAGAFHGATVLNDSLITMAGIASDIKWFVNPQSAIDVQAVNDSASGSYHSGDGSDITTPQFNKQIDMQVIMSMIDKLQRQIAKAFLMSGEVIRDAERVTAEEVRRVAQELELSHGGIYSRFAEEWQLRLAILMLRRIDFNITGTDRAVYPQIITGLDSLSRAGDLDNLRLFVSDLQLLEGVPQGLQSVIDPFKFTSFVGIRRGVEYDKFTKSREQLEAEQQQAMALQQQQLNMQAAANVGQAAGTAMVQGGQ